MTRLITSELFKLRTTRTFYGVVGGALALVVGIVVLAAATGTWHRGDTPLRDLMGISGFAQVFALVLGILAVTSEFRHGTITPSLLAVPDRTRLVLAKLITALIAGALLGLAASALCAVITLPILSARDAGTGSDSTEIRPGTDPAAGSTWIAVTSGAAAWIAPSTANCSVTVEEGQLSQVPSNRSVTTPASSIPNSSTSPPWEPRYGRTLSNAAATRVVTSYGWRPCTRSRPETSSSEARASRATASRRPASANTSSSRSSPAP